MNTKTVKTNADIFHNRFVETLAEHKRHYEESRRDFIKFIESDAAGAIAHRGECVVRCEAAFKTLDHSWRFLNNAEDHGGRKQAIRAAIDFFYRDLAHSATDRPSSDAVANGVDFAKRCGVADAIRVLERLAGHDFI